MLYIPCQKSWQQGNPLSNIMRNPLPDYTCMLGGVMHDCASILDSIAKEIYLLA